MGIKRKLMEDGVRRNSGGKSEVGRERWRVVGVYVNGDMERILQDI